MPQMNPRLEHREVNALLRIGALVHGRADVIHLEFGEPDFPTPAHIVAAAEKSLANERQTYGLLNRVELDKIERRVNEKGLTIVPLALYFLDGRAKVEIALAKGKKSWDKRHALAERQANRETEQAVGRRLKGME